MTDITDTILSEFKERMKIKHQSEDVNLKRLLSFSYAAIQRSCGKFDISSHLMGKELVFERTRYAYNDSLEFFTENFLPEVVSLSIELRFGGKEVSNAD